jgi:hypothetical protein
MAYENNNEFTDWLYNRYVEAMRKNDIMRQFVFYDVLNEYINKTLNQHKFRGLKRYANNLLKTIQKAHKNGTAKKLELSGDEWQLEFQKAMADYEKNLREMDFDENTIREMIIEKKMNYGNN